VNEISSTVPDQHVWICRHPAPPPCVLGPSGLGHSGGSAWFGLGLRILACTQGIGRCPDVHFFGTGRGEAQRGSELPKKLAGKLVRKLIQELVQELLWELISKHRSKLGPKLTSKLPAKLAQNLNLNLNL